jgi:hypothetical protein
MKKRICVLEDNDEILEIIKIVLEDEIMTFMDLGPLLLLGLTT